jgi:hypothetical protein
MVRVTERIMERITGWQGVDDDEKVVWALGLETQMRLESPGKFFYYFLHLFYI